MKDFNFVARISEINKMLWDVEPLPSLAVTPDRPDLGSQYPSGCREK